MHIAYVTETYPPELNGVALTVERAVRYLRERGHRVELIRPRQPGESACDTPDEWRTFGCAIPVYPDLHFGLARRASLRRRFARNRPDLVHLATPGPLGWSALAAARSLGIATTSEFRTNFHQYSRHYGVGWLSALILQRLRTFHNASHRTFVPTRAVKHDLEAQGFHKLTIVGRGVDTVRFDPQRRSAALRAEWRAAAAPVLLYVGRIAAEKNIVLALQAFEASRRLRPDTRMIVVGDGPIHARLAARFPAARFVGVQRGAALAESYASADLFLFPSLSDTFGNVTVEALASGLPVVAYDTAAAAEHVGDGISGALAAPGAAADFIAAVTQLVTHPEQLAAMRPAARAAALRTQWGDVLVRFEASLQATIDAVETPSGRAALAA